MYIRVVTLSCEFIPRRDFCYILSIYILYSLPMGKMHTPSHFSVRYIYNNIYIYQHSFSY